MRRCRKYHRHLMTLGEEEFVATAAELVVAVATATARRRGYAFAGRWFKRFAKDLLAQATSDETNDATARSEPNRHSIAAGGGGVNP